MSEHFDPYHKWLGIASAEQPPNHYRLLGLNLFESDLDVIENGSDRQMAHLRTYQSGPRMRECQQLLNEVAGARVVLLDPQRKAAYDQTLRAAFEPVEAPPPIQSVPLTPADTMLPATGAPAAPTAPPSGSSFAAPTSSVVVAKKSSRYRKQAMGPGAIAAAGAVGLVVLLAGGFVLRSTLRPEPAPITTVARPADVAPASRVEPVKPVVPPAKSPPVTPVVPVSDEPIASQPANALVGASDEYDCTLKSQPQLAIDSSFDSTKSWRLSMRVNASSHPHGTLLAWGDSRASLDPICIKAGPDYINGWVTDNTRAKSTTNLPKLPIDWSAWHEIELVHDAVGHVLQLRVDNERGNVSVTYPPRPDCDMPVYLGGIGMGALHAYPCRLREVRLEQLTDPVNLPPASTLAVMPSPEANTKGKPPAQPEPPSSLADLVSATGTKKLPVPTEAELTAARAQLERLFANELSKERSPQESATFADELKNNALQPGTEPIMRYVMLEAAVTVAARGGAVDSAAEAIWELDRAFSADIPRLKTDAARQLARVAKEAWEHQAVAEMMETVIDECVAADRYDLAASLADAAGDAARKSKDSSTQSRVTARARDIKSLNAKYEPVRAAMTVLADAADDPAANETVGQHLCLVKGNWEQGLPYLVKSGASPLRDVAARDIRKPTTPQTQAALAGDWLKMAAQLEKRLQLHAYWRAEYWNRLALASESGVKRLPLEQQINDIGSEVGKLAELPPGAVLVMTFEPSTLKRQGYVLDASQHGYVGVVNKAVLADGIAGKAFAFDGKSSYIEVASTPWLSAPSTFTIAAWTNAASWKAPRDFDYVVSKQQNKSDAIQGYSLRYESSGLLAFAFGTTRLHVATANAKTSIREWHHMAATYDGQNCKVFLDGEFAGETFAPGPLRASDAPLRIGQSAHFKDRGVRGFIDEVAIFNRGLEPEEVRTVYRIGRAGRPLME